jgi:hypothetical protein
LGAGRWPRWALVSGRWRKKPLRSTGPNIGIRQARRKGNRYGHDLLPLRSFDPSRRMAGRHLTGLGFPPLKFTALSRALVGVAPSAFKATSRRSGEWNDDDFDVLARG